jgi:hypothetical protein
MAMSLAGFHSSGLPVFDSEDFHECLSYLGLWTIESGVSFFFSALVSFGLAFGLEYVAARWTQLQHPRMQIPSREQRRMLKALNVMIYLLGYLAMLVAMTYSIELLAALVAGHMVGHYQFSVASSKYQPLGTSVGSFSPTTGNIVRTPSSRAKSHQKEFSYQALSLFLRSLRWKNRESHHESNGFFAFPTARERVRRQQQPKRHRNNEGRHHNRSEGDSDDESEDVEESTTRDEDDLPFLRKREVVR